MRAILVLFVSLLIGLGTADAEPIDDIANDYVKLTLAAAQHVPDIYESYEGPESWKAEAAAAKIEPSTIIQRSGALIERLDRLPKAELPLLAQRHAWLRANLVSLRMQMEAKGGAKWPVGEEVRLRYGFTPDFRPLAEYDAILARLDKQLSGGGTLSERIARLREGSRVPKDKVQAVQQAALVECRRRAASKLKFPVGESVETRWGDDPLFGGSNIYEGNGHSVSEFSRAYAWEVDQILWVTCHEMYPGHHLHFATQSAELFKKRRWPEFSIWQAAGPMIPAAEAVAEYGVGLAFPIEERIRFERDVLYPLAGLTMGNPDEWRAYWTAKWDMLGATSSVAQLYLDGKLDKEQARAAFMKYRMMNRDGADKIVPVLDHVGSYIIASDVGWMTIDRRLRNRPEAEQWRTFQQILEQPMTVADLQKL